MPGSKSDYFSTKILDFLRGQGAATNPLPTVSGGGCWLALYTTQLTAASTNAATGEVSTSTDDDQYARKRLNDTDWTITTDTLANNKDITLYTANTLAGNYTVESWAIVTGGNAGTSDNILYWCDEPALTVADGNEVKLTSGAALNITEN